jgi:thioredoxin-like negative regulator of GroEL
MIPLQTQEQFEALLKPRGIDGKPNPEAIVVYFTAAWCGACSKLNHDEIQSASPSVTWYKCDVDQNKYTLGYCGLQKIPSFAFIKNSKFLGKLTSSDTDVVIDILNETFN